MRTGINQSATHLSASQPVLVLKTFFRRIPSMARQRFTNEQLKARLVVFIGAILGVVFLGSVFGILWALIFVTQPLGEQAPNDRAFIELLTTLTVFLTGSLGAVLAGNGLKDKPKKEDNEPA
jgi:galactitol-specific phosphotransferase system IIC component